MRLARLREHPGRRDAEATDAEPEDQPGRVERADSVGPAREAVPERLEEELARIDDAEACALDPRLVAGDVRRPPVGLVGLVQLAGGGARAREREPEDDRFKREELTG